MGCQQLLLIHPDQAKTKKAIPVPLNEDAIAVLKNRMGKHNEYVFTYQGKRIIQRSILAYTPMHKNLILMLVVKGVFCWMES